MLATLVHDLDLDDEVLGFELDLRVEELSQRAVLLTDCGRTLSDCCGSWNPDCSATSVSA